MSGIDIELDINDVWTVCNEMAEDFYPEFGDDSVISNDEGITDIEINEDVSYCNDNNK